MSNIENIINENIESLGKRVEDTQPIDFDINQIVEDLNSVNIRLAEKAWQKGSRWRLTGAEIMSVVMPIEEPRNRSSDTFVEVDMCACFIGRTSPLIPVGEVDVPIDEKIVKLPLDALVTLNPPFPISIDKEMIAVGRGTNRNTPRLAFTIFGQTILDDEELHREGIIDLMEINPLGFLFNDQKDELRDRECIDKSAKDILRILSFRAPSVRSITVDLVVRLSSSELKNWTRSHLMSLTNQQKKSVKNENMFFNSGITQVNRLLQSPSNLVAIDNWISGRSNEVLKWGWLDNPLIPKPSILHNEFDLNAHRKLRDCEDDGFMSDTGFEGSPKEVIDAINRHLEISKFVLDLIDSGENQSISKDEIKRQLTLSLGDLNE